MFNGYFMNSKLEMEFDYSVVLPCLNEERTLKACIEEIYAAAGNLDLKVEIIVADNGSTDNSTILAHEAGARVIDVPIRGYGAALDAGIRNASTEFVIMADSDMSYDFGFAPTIYTALSKGEFDLVMGNRFKGGIEPGAMPNLHKYLGNPVLSFIGRIFFRLPIRDFHCGLRGVRRSFYLRVNPVTTGMEFATEMIIKFANMRARICEIPVTLRRDGRDRKPHLRSFPDGWRHLKLMLLYSPHFFQLYPGLFLSFFSGIGLSEFALKGRINLFLAHGNVQAAIFFLFIFTVGLQVTAAGLLSIALAKSKGINRFTVWEKIEKILRSRFLVGISLSFIAVGIIGLAILGEKWIAMGYGWMDPVTESKRSIPLVAVIITGIQMLLCSIQVRQVLSRFW